MGLLSTTANSDEWYLGKWEVVDAKFPGISAIGKAEAELWFGNIATYSKSKIEFRNNICVAPEYETKELTANKFYSYFSATFKQLEIDGSSTQIINVKCKNSSGIASSDLIKSNDGFAYKLWDGVFFKLKHVPIQVN